MSDKKENFSEEIYGTILNGRVDFKHSAKNLLARKQVTYYNPKTGKMQTQNYFDMEDIVVPVIIRKNATGELEFAMQYEYIPAVNKVFLELPECPFFDVKKAHYNDDDVTQIVDDRMFELGLEMIGFRYLDKSETAVSQSVTDQQAKFIAVYVEEFEKDDNLKWFPITSIKDFFENIGDNSSLQTKYALQLFYSKYRGEILKKQPTQFSYDKNVVGKPIGDWEDKKNIMEHKHRFGIELSENNEPENSRADIKNFGQISEYGLSKNSSNCLIIKKENNKIMIGLSKQQRSPFVEREGTDEYFYEFVGGMVEDGEPCDEAAKREALEETGLDIKDLKLIHIESPTLASKAFAEHGDFYLCEIKEGIVKSYELELDEQEDIDEIEWFDLYEINLQEMRIPLGTKYIIEKTRLYYEEERKRQVEDIER